MNPLQGNKSGYSRGGGGGGGMSEHDTASNLINKNDLFTAVKFGRMSKKQREKVEDEANFVKQNRLNGYDPTSPTGMVSPNNNNQFPSQT